MVNSLWRNVETVKGSRYGAILVPVTTLLSKCSYWYIKTEYVIDLYYGVVSGLEMELVSMMKNWWRLWRLLVMGGGLSSPILGLWTNPYIDMLVWWCRFRNCIWFEEWSSKSGDIWPSAFWDEMVEFWSYLVCKTRRITVARAKREIWNAINAEMDILIPKINYGTNQ